MADHRPDWPRRRARRRVSDAEQPRRAMIEIVHSDREHHHPGHRPEDPQTGPVSHSMRQVAQRRDVEPPHPRDHNEADRPKDPQRARVPVYPVRHGRDDPHERQVIEQLEPGDALVGMAGRFGRRRGCGIRHAVILPRFGCLPGALGYGPWAEGQTPGLQCGLLTLQPTLPLGLSSQPQTLPETGSRPCSVASSGWAPATNADGPPTLVRRCRDGRDGQAC